MNQPLLFTPPKPFWHPLVAGVALGFVLLLTFVIMGHGLGATGFTTEVAAWLVSGVDRLAGPETYLGPMAEDGLFSAWITWQVIGVVIGAFVSAKLARRIRIQIDGQKTLGRSRRLITAFAGGVLAGLGANRCRLHKWHGSFWRCDPKPCRLHISCYVLRRGSGGEPSCARGSVNVNDRNLLRAVTWVRFWLCFGERRFRKSV